MRSAQGLFCLLRLGVGSEEGPDLGPELGLLGGLGRLDLGGHFSHRHTHSLAPGPPPGKVELQLAE